VNLLRQAREAGLRVTAQGDLLVVEGPRRLERLAQTLLAEKPRILLALEQEEDAVGWRVRAMRTQMTRQGGIPLLLARPGTRFPLGACCSCGDQLGPDDRYRCGSCATAAVIVVAEAGDALR
jgi:hypothetical protein